MDKQNSVNAIDSDLKSRNGNNSSKTFDHEPKDQHQPIMESIGCPSIAEVLCFGQ